MLCYSFNRDLLTEKDVSDVNEEAGKAQADKYGVKYFKDFRELANHVEAVTVVVPTFLHHDVAKYFLENALPLLFRRN